MYVLNQFYSLTFSFLIFKITILISTPQGVVIKVKKIQEKYLTHSLTWTKYSVSISSASNVKITTGGIIIHYRINVRIS